MILSSSVMRPYQSGPARIGQRPLSFVPGLFVRHGRNAQAEAATPREREEEVSIEFSCLMQKHSWSWLLSD
jgi:hypothetical protein